MFADPGHVEEDKEEEDEETVETKTVTPPGRVEGSRVGGGENTTPTYTASNFPSEAKGSV